MGFFHVDECDEIDVDRYNKLEDCLTNFGLYLTLRKERKKQLAQEAQRREAIHKENIEFFRNLGQAKIAENYEKFLQSEKNTTLLSAIHEDSKLLTNLCEKLV